MADSSITFGSVFGVIIVQEERKYKDVFFCFYLCPRVCGGTTRQGRGFDSRRGHWGSSLV